MSNKKKNRDRSKQTTPAMIESLENRALMSVVAQQVGGDIPMRLPFQNGMQVLMNNGYGNIGDSDHHGFAVDFKLNQGTTVLAPFGGTVVDIGTYSGNSTTGVGLTAREQLGQFVKIEGRGTTATWDVWLAHLSSVSVAVGSQVGAGQQIGLSGNTGYSTGAHLHEQIYNANGTPARPVYVYGIDRTSGTSSRLITDFVQGDIYEAVAMGPANDHFASGAVISGVSISLSGNNNGATKEPGEVAAVGSGGASVWYTWTAPYNGNYVIDTTGSNFDTTLGVYQGGSVGGLQRVATDDDSGGNLTSKLTISGVANQTYRIAVDGYSASTGNFNLHIAGYSPAPNLPAKPTGLTSTRVAAGQISLSWLNNWSGATGIDAQYWTGSAWATFWTGSPTTNRLTVNAGAGSQFYLQVVAFGSQGRYASDYILATF